MRRIQLVSLFVLFFSTFIIEGSAQYKNHDDLFKLIPDKEVPFTFTIVTSDGNWLISATEKFINKWNLNNGEYTQVILKSIPDNFAICEISNNGKYIAFQGKNKSSNFFDLYIIDTENGKTIKKVVSFRDSYYYGSYFGENESTFTYFTIKGLTTINLQNPDEEIITEYFDIITGVVKLHNTFYLSSNTPTPQIRYMTEGSKRIRYNEFRSKSQCEFYCKPKESVYKMGYSDGLFYFISKKKDSYKSYVKRKSDKKPILLCKAHKPAYNSSDNIDLSKLVYVGIQTSGLFHYVHKETGKVYIYFHKVTNPNYNINIYGENSLSYTKVNDIFLKQNSTGDFILYKDGEFEVSDEIFQNSKIKYEVFNNYKPFLLATPKNEIEEKRYLKKTTLFHYTFVDNPNKYDLLNFLVSQNYINVDISNFSNNYINNNKFENILTSKANKIKINGEAWYVDTSLGFRMVNNNLNFYRHNCYGYEDGYLWSGKYNPNGHFTGKKTYKDDSYEEGTFINKLLQGKGSIYHKDYSYKGEFKNGLMHGQGEYIWKNGDKYIGNFTHGNFDGEGTVTFSDGSYYKGKFKNSKYHGYGIQYNAETKEEYQGIFSQGLRNGDGTIYKNGRFVKYASFINNEEVDIVEIARDLKKKYYNNSNTEKNTNQSENNNKLIGEWQGPNGKKMTFNSNGTGYLSHETESCTLKIKSWRTSNGILYITWDMTPLNCTNTYLNQNFEFVPKAENERIKYNITKESKEIGGYTFPMQKLHFENLDRNSKGYWTKVVMDEIDTDQFD